MSYFWTLLQDIAGNFYKEINFIGIWNVKATSLTLVNHKCKKYVLPANSALKYSCFESFKKSIYKVSIVEPGFIKVVNTPVVSKMK